MRNLFLGLMLLAGTVSFANTNVKASKISVSNKAIVTTCYVKAADDFGNTYYKRVTCPKTIILQ